MRVVSLGRIAAELSLTACLVLPAGALLLLWGLGRRRGADARPLLVLGALVASGLCAMVAARGFSALLGGPSRGVLLLMGSVNSGVVLLVAAVLVWRGAPAAHEPEQRNWLRIYLVSLGLLITLGMRVAVLMSGRRVTHARSILEKPAT